MGVVGWRMTSQVFLRDMGLNQRLLWFIHLYDQATWVYNSPYEQPGLTGAGSQAPWKLVGWVKTRRIPQIIKKITKI